MGMGEQDWTSYLSVSKGAKSRDGLKKRWGLQIHYFCYISQLPYLRRSMVSKFHLISQATYIFQNENFLFMWWGVSKVFC
jgi:hypothetical protein